MYEIIKEINDDTCLAIKDAHLYVLKRIDPGDSNIYKSLTQLNNPNIAAHFGCIAIENKFYAVEDYIQGCTLEEYCRANYPLNTGRIRGIADGICNGLRDIHRLGIIHRDITPTNIIIDSGGTPVIIDFGISRRFKPDKSKDTRILGTQGYAAPEQYGFAQTGAQADIYSLGVLINYMATLKTPDEELPKNELYGIVRKCIEIDPVYRYKNIDELSNALNGRSAEAWLRAIPGFRRGNGINMLIASFYYMSVAVIIAVIIGMEKSIKALVMGILWVIFSMLLPVPVLTNYMDWINKLEFTKRLTSGGRLAFRIIIAFALEMMSVVFIMLSGS